jgi:predicted permease
MRRLLESLLSDLRYALRGFARTPGPFLLAASTMALGIGATTAVFTLVDRILFRNLPYAEPNRLVWFGMKAPISTTEFLLEGDYLRFQQHQQVFDSVTSLTNPGDCDLNEREPLRLNCADIAGNFLPTFGVKLFLGRNFTAAESMPNGPRAALLSYGFWQRRFGGNAGVIGRTLTVDGRPVQVAGVLPPDFELPTLARADILRSQQVVLQASRAMTFLFGFGRLKSGITAVQARAALNPIYRECLKFVPPGFVKEVSFHVTPLHERQVRDYRAVSVVLLAAVIGILLIACANVAGLLLARADARRREFAVRTAIGAPRARLTRQLLTESVTLALAGGAAGLLLGAVLLRLLVKLAPAGIPHLSRATLDTRVLLIALAVCVGSGLLFGLAPALRTPRAETLNLARVAGGRLRLRQALVAFQIGLTCMLLSGALMLVESLRNLHRVPLGMRPEQLLTIRVQLGRERFNTAAQQAAFFARAAESLKLLPGVRALALSDTVPLYGYANTMIFSNIEIEGRPPLSAQRATGGMTIFRTVSPAYFEVMGIPIARGRAFLEADRTSAEQVAIIDENLARRLFPNENPIGHRMRSGLSGPFRTIVGVARNVKNASLTQGDDPEYYYVWRAGPESGRGRAHVLLRSQAEPAALAQLVRSEIARIDPTLPLTITTMEQNLGRYIERPRFESVLLGLFAVLAIALAAVGQFGVIQSLVTERTPEIGVRMALGATPLQMVGMVLRQVIVWALAGASCGVAGAWFCARWLEALLFGVKPRDPASYAAVLGALLAVSIASAWRPARRAAGLDPAQVLRHEA